MSDGRSCCVTGSKRALDQGTPSSIRDRRFLELGAWRDFRSVLSNPLLLRLRCSFTSSVYEYCTCLQPCWVLGDGAAQGVTCL